MAIHTASVSVTFYRLRLGDKGEVDFWRIAVQPK